MCLEEDLVIVKTLKYLESLNPTDTVSDAIAEQCNLLTEECKKGMAEKVLCSNHRGYEILVNLTKKSNDHPNVQASAIRALAILLDKNPDAFDEEGFSVVITGLQPNKGIWPFLKSDGRGFVRVYKTKYICTTETTLFLALYISDNEVIQATLDLALSCCVLHEINRQNLVKNGLLDRLDLVVDNNEIQGDLTITHYSILVP